MNAPLAKLRVIEGLEPRREAGDDRRVGRARAGRNRRGSDDLERVVELADAPDDLSQEPTDADPPAAGYEQARAASVGRGLERDREVGELPLAPHEPFAAELRGHLPMLPHDPGSAIAVRAATVPRHA